MVFNPDITKQDVEVIFSVKNNPPLCFIFTIPVAREPFTKHFLQTYRRKHIKGHEWYFHFKIPIKACF